MHRIATLLRKTLNLRNCKIYKIRFMNIDNENKE